MSDSNKDSKKDSKREAIGKALGKIPSGLFVASCGLGTSSVPFLASWVQQCDLEEPLLMMSVQKGREAIAALDGQKGAFTVSVLPEGRHDLMKPFFQSKPEAPFGDLETCRAPDGGVYLKEALAWMECSEIGRADAGDHVVIIARVVAGGLLQEAKPAIHVRKSGFSY